MYLKHITPILNVSSLEESFAWFGKLGWNKCWDWGDPPTFASVGCGECELFLCKDGQGSRGDTGGVWMSWWVRSPAEVDAAHARAVEHGLTVTSPPSDRPWGVRECHLRHPDGHTFRVSAHVGH
jgi:catechol 2,3-dioxygenase-like lactoylglutathione lyase family enzyme